MSRERTARDHFTAGLELLTDAERAPTGPAAAGLAGLAAAHFAASTAILTKHMAELGPEGIDSRWNWRGATV